MSKLFKPLMISALVAGAVGNVQAASEVAFIPSAGITQKNLQYGRDFNDGSGTQVADASFIGLNVGVTAVFDSFYVSGSIDQALTEGGFNDDSNEDASSDAITLTMGCNCLAGAEALTVFAGFTSIDILAEAADIKEDSNDSGFFFGASYPFVSTNSGQLTATVAYASLDGELNVSGSALGATVLTFTGDTTGLSYGLAWSGAASEQMNYSLSVKINDYSFDASNLSDQTGASTSVGLNLDRVFTILGAKVTYFF